MGNRARLSEGSKSLLNTVLKSLGIICLLAFLCYRCIGSFVMACRVGVPEILEVSPHM